MKAEPNTDDWRLKFSEHYSQTLAKPGLSGRILLDTHYVIERPFGSEAIFPSVLEVGAGSGAHFGFVRHRFERYLMTDASPHFVGQMREKFAAQPRVAVAQSDAAVLEFEDNSFDRLVATHVLEHLYQPHLVLREWNRVIRPGGVLSLILPCDPGLAWRIGRHFGPRRAALKSGLPYDFFMARDHVNSFFTLVELIRYYFADRDESWWPFRFASADLNLIYGVNITVSKPVPP